MSEWNPLLSLLSPTPIFPWYSLSYWKGQYFIPKVEVWEWHQTSRYCAHHSTCFLSVCLVCIKQVSNSWLQAIVLFGLCVVLKSRQCLRKIQRSNEDPGLTLTWQQVSGIVWQHPQAATVCLRSVLPASCCPCYVLGVSSDPLCPALWTFLMPAKDCCVSAADLLPALVFLPTCLKAFLK